MYQGGRSVGCLLGWSVGGCAPVNALRTDRYSSVYRYLLWSPVERNQLSLATKSLIGEWGGISGGGRRRRHSPAFSSATTDRNLYLGLTRGRGINGYLRRISQTIVDIRRQQKHRPSRQQRVRQLRQKVVKLIFP